MKKIIADSKIIKKRMVDMDIKTIAKLSEKAGVSKPTLYDYLNGKTPISAPFCRLCDHLNLDISDVLIEVDDEREAEND